jgi:hypothetical protein
MITNTVQNRVAYGCFVGLVFFLILNLIAYKKPHNN